MYCFINERKCFKSDETRLVLNILKDDVQYGSNHSNYLIQADKYMYRSTSCVLYITNTNKHDNLYKEYYCITGFKGVCTRAIPVM